MLSSSSSNDADHRNIAQLTRQESTSSAGSDVGDGPAIGYLKSGNNKLDLASLPNPIANAAPSTTQTALTTPTPKTLDTHGLSQPKRKTSNPMHANIPAIVKKSQETDGDEATDGAPYDGDVEYAARSSLPHQQSGIVSSSSGLHAGSSMTTANASGASSSTPTDIPCNRYISSATKATGDETLDEKAEGQQVSMATPASIRSFIHKAIYEPDPARPYRINIPAEGGKSPARPIRIYADGVYDLFHYAHSLQLRQAKLFFPQVYLIVGVVSSTSCAKHKNAPVLSSSERYTSVRNCKWVDEVVEDCPWVISQEFIDKYQIDYVAHDEEPYVGSDGDADIYKLCKDQGKFLPTQRTVGVSTSELLARIVDQYRHHNYDKKLAKIGHEELAFIESIR
jgi:choline-phosphate cytidylyltransferase